jgi:hypothetical protein
MEKQITLQQAKTGKTANHNQIEELKQLMTSISSSQIKEKNGLSTYTVDKSLGEALSLGMRTEILSKQIKFEVNENIQKIITQVKIQENIQLAEREQFKQSNRGMDFGL